MTGAQQAKYFWEWGRCRDYYRSKGLSAAQADAKRHELHVKALGKAKSSKSFTNADLDKVLGVFRAVFDSSNLDAQLDVIDQPEKRRGLMMDRCLAAGEVFISGENKHQREFRTISYCRGIWTKLGYDTKPWNWPILDVPEFAKVMGVIEAHAARVRAKQAKEEEQLAAVPADAADEEITG